MRTGGIVNNILDGRSDLTVPASIPSFLGIHELSTLKSETVSRKSFALQDKVTLTLITSAFSLHCFSSFMLITLDKAMKWEIFHSKVSPFSFILLLYFS